MSFMVEIISQETVKPSSPTPPHLRTLNLSLLDQYASPFQFPLLLFYTANDNNKVALTPGHLKDSLSEVLTSFYPLAGRIESNQFIDCNDEGVNFFQARVNTRLSELISHPVPEQLVQLLPTDNFFRIGPKVLLSIQINMFVCGQFALGVCMSHKAGDASSLALFLNSWSHVGKQNEILAPKFDHTSFFHPEKVVTPFIPTFGGAKVVSKRFVFDSSNIAALKSKCTEKPSRVEAISALIWRCVMKPASAKMKSMVLLAVNLRGRFVPPLSDLYVGNLFVGAEAISKTEIQPEMHVLVSEIHKTITKIDGAYIKRLQADGGVATQFESVKDATEKSARGEIDLLSITSWCRFPFYECDFGWGTPEWICTVNFVCPNIVMLMDTKCGEGVEAWVALYEEDMVRFESELKNSLPRTTNDSRCT